MTEKMWALTFDRNADGWTKSTGLVRREVPRPRLDSKRDPSDRSWVIVKMHYAGFCGSDRGIWYRKSFGDQILETLEQEKKDIRITGHELLGEIVEVGEDVERLHGYKVGEVVAAESHLICGECYQCKRDETHVCRTDRIIGISFDGCFAEYVKVPARVLWRVDLKKIRPEVAAVQEPFGNAVHACTKVDLKDQTVAIIGCGTIGLFAVAIAKALGARKVIGVEPLEAHAQMARKLGADVVLTPSKGTGDHRHDEVVAAELRRLTDGVGVDVALEMSGINASLNTAIAGTRRGGHIVLFGLKAGDAVVEKIDRIIMNGQTLHTVVGRRIFQTWEVTRRLLESRTPNIHDLVWEVILQGGKGTILPFAEFEPKRFEEIIGANPKVLFKF